MDQTQTGFGNPMRMKLQTSSKSKLACRVIKPFFPSFLSSILVPTLALLSPPFCYQLSTCGFGRRRHDSQQQQLPPSLPLPLTRSSRRIHPSLFRTGLLFFFFFFLEPLSPLMTRGYSKVSTCKLKLAQICLRPPDFHFLIPEV